jgi:threonine dehydratase
MLDEVSAAPLSTSQEPKRIEQDCIALPSLSEIQKARRSLEGVSVYTPMEESRWLSAVLEGPVSLKAENLQRTGSFKIRGAYVRMGRLSPSERRNGVVAASAGNHAQGVALAAQLLGIKATVFMPEAAPLPKERATRAYGAEVRFHGATLDEALVAAKAFAEETQATFIHPFDHIDILRGHGTCGLEILEQRPDLRTVVVPAGGGGLVGGIAAAIKQMRPEVRVVAVQAKGAAAYPPSVEAGRPLSLPRMSTMADGIAVGRPGEVPFRAVTTYVDDIVTVSEEWLSRALVMLLERAKLVVEPAGAAAVAALLQRPDDYATPAVAVLSGGNVDPLLLMRVIRHGMASTGRYMSLRVPVPDVPGGLADFLRELAGLEVNVLDVMHERISADLALGSVDVAVQLETRGPTHAARVLARLAECGYDVSLAGKVVPSDSSP